MLQVKAGRRHAPPLVDPSPGLPLIKSVPSLGRRLEWRKGRINVDADATPQVRKGRIKWAVERFVEWMGKEDRAYPRYDIALPIISGPYPHFNPKPPNTQIGDRGGKRKVARQVIQDLDNGEQDYVIEVLFEVPEYITELPTDLAVELFSRGRPGIKPMREKEWRWLQPKQ